MNTAVVNIKTEKALKVQAHQVADELGLSLSSILNAYLRQLVRTRSVYFDATSEKPTEYFMKVLKDSEKERKNGKSSPVFSNSKAAISWLRDQEKKE